MAWFSCLVVGENFLLDGEDGPELMGFVTARYASAVTFDKAELIILENLREEYEIFRPQKTRTDKPAKVHFEEITELSEEPKHIPNKGATWYVMDNTD